MPEPSDHDRGRTRRTSGHERPAAPERGENGPGGPTGPGGPGGPSGPGGAGNGGPGAGMRPSRGLFGLVVFFAVGFALFLLLAQMNSPSQAVTIAEFERMWNNGNLDKTSVQVRDSGAYAKQLVFCSEASPAHFDPALQGTIAP